MKAPDDGKLRWRAVPECFGEYRVRRRRKCRRCELKPWCKQGGNRPNVVEIPDFLDGDAT